MLQRQATFLDHVHALRSTLGDGYSYTVPTDFTGTLEQHLIPLFGANNQ